LKIFFLHSDFSLRRERLKGTVYRDGSGRKWHESKGHPVQLLANTVIAQRKFTDKNQVICYSFQRRIRRLPSPTLSNSAEDSLRVFLWKK
jgi:hypothetical protein